MPSHTSPSWQNSPCPAQALPITPIAGMHPRRKEGLPAPSVVQVRKDPRTEPPLLDKECTPGNRLSRHTARPAHPPHTHTARPGVTGQPG